MRKIIDIFVIGFALFSMFFGAGNLLFPPYLGVLTAGEWEIGFLGFILADIGIALAVIVASAQNKGDLNSIFERSGKKFAIALSAITVLCIGPLFAIPRTAATTFDMALAPIIPNMPAWGNLAFTITFFALVFVLTIRENKVVDIIGKFLTPVLLGTLIILIIKGIINPMGEISATPLINNNIFVEGIQQGYLTMDALGATALSTVVILSIIKKGYTSSHDITKMTILAGIIAGICLAVIYGGLTFLGATLSLDPSIANTTNQAIILSEMTNRLFGNGGKILVGVVVSFACLTTAIGLTSAVAGYFESLFKNKISYGKLVTIITVASFLISNIGLAKIISLSLPILEIIYPVLIVLTFLSFLTKHIKNDNVFKCAAYFTLAFSILNLINNNFDIIPFMENLPLASVNFSWILPALLGMLVGSLIKPRNKVKA